VNHSFHPNCLPTAYGVEIAVRDIRTGEELSNDYGCFNLIEPFTPKSEGTIRQEVRPDDLLIYYADWDLLIREALNFYPQVEQLLGKWMDRDLAETLHEVASGRIEMRSTRDLFFKGAAPVS
jgi:hypothetical protein